MSQFFLHFCVLLFQKPEDRETGYLETAPLPDLLRIFSRSMTYPGV